MTDWVSCGSHSLSSKHKRTFISLLLIHNTESSLSPPSLGVFVCYFNTRGPHQKIRSPPRPLPQFNWHHTPVTIKRAFTHYDTHFISLHPGLIVPRGVAENTLTDELLLTSRDFIWISFHLWEHYGLNVEQSRFCVLELVRYGAVLNRARLQTHTYLREKWLVLYTQNTLSLRNWVIRWKWGCIELQVDKCDTSCVFGSRRVREVHEQKSC